MTYIIRDKGKDENIHIPTPEAEAEIEAGIAELERGEVCGLGRGPRRVFAPPSVNQYRVFLSARAMRQIERASDWWRAHRDKAPGAFDEEIDAAFRVLRSNPHTGTPVRARGTGIRSLWIERIARSGTPPAAHARSSDITARYMSAAALDAGERFRYFLGV